MKYLIKLWVYNAYDHLQSYKIRDVTNNCVLCNKKRKSWVAIIQLSIETRYWLDNDLSLLLCLIYVFVEYKILHIDAMRHELPIHIFFKFSYIF
jgi:hypothetical protein